MYFGSVRFFKHVLLLVIGLVIITLLICVVVSSARYQELSGKLEAYTQSPENAPPAQSTGDFAGYSPYPASDEGVSDVPASPAIDYTPADIVSDENRLYYQELYPELYCDEPVVFQKVPERTAFLSFCNGPSDATDKILDSLRISDVKATFFIVGSNIPGHEKQLKRIVEEGHSIGLYCNSIDYRTLYRSVEDYLKDFSVAYRRIRDASGKAPVIFRFPGGSVNGYNSAIYKPLIAEMLRRGFLYYDWNVSAEDAFGSVTAESIRDNIFKDLDRFDYGIILLHESEKTADAISSTIREISSRGYKFDRLTRDVRPVIFAYAN